MRKGVERNVERRKRMIVHKDGRNDRGWTGKWGRIRREKAQGGVFQPMMNFRQQYVQTTSNMHGQRGRSQRMVRIDMEKGSKEV
jgi:hypothetical protein